MTQDRYNALKTALYEHIELKKFSDDRAVLAWLVSSLDEWVERLEGAFSWGRIEQTDFFGGLMTNIEVIDEVRSRREFTERFPEQDWREFRNAVTWLEKTRDHEEMALVEKTYQEFKHRFAAISEENSNPEREPGARIDSNPSRTDGRQSVNQGGAPKIELDGPTQVEWWPRFNLLSPLELKISRAILSLAILALLGGLLCLVLSLIETNSRPRAAALDQAISVCCFYLSVLSFSIWAALRLWFKVWRRLGK